MVDNTIQSVLNAEHKLESMVESSTDGSTDTTEKEFQELRRMTEQVTLSAIKATENWGRNALNKSKEYVEEISL
jgi:hypothetical protein